MGIFVMARSIFGGSSGDSCACPAPKPWSPTTKVTLQRINPTASENDMAEVDLSDDANWITLGSRWCSVKSRGGTERFSSDQIQAGITLTVRMRYDALTKALTPLDRFKLGTRLLNIFGVYDEDEMHRYVVADCIEAK